jgi:hypothetical protein
MIEWYRVRWEIVMFFHVLKNGCRIEVSPLASGCLVSFWLRGLL